MNTKVQPKQKGVMVRAKNS